MNEAAVIRDLETVWIPMSDGCRLAARIWMPESAEHTRLPAILEYIPYRRRDFTRRRDETMHPWLAAHGYVAIRVDMRGSGDSDGILHDEYLVQEQDDAVEVIAWIARQPWCSGKVGMMGKSWGAYNSLQVAARRPPALAAVIAVMGTDDRFAECIHYSGGALLNDNFWWGCIMQLFNARPPDPQTVGERWREMWLERLQTERFWPEIWLRRQRLDDYWKHASVCFNYGAIECPVWFWGGWADLYRDTPFRLAEHLQVPHKITMGPWAHLYPHEAIPGPAVGFLQESLRWWDHWLKGKETGVTREPPLRLYMMESVPPVTHLEERAGHWIEEREWPSPNVETRTLALGSGTLGAFPAPSGNAALTVSSPQITGLAAGDWASFGVPGDLPGDQSLDSFGSLEFDGEPLSERLEVLGQACTALELAVDRPVAIVTARLIDVAPDGRGTLVARGFLNLSQRDGREQPLPLVPGKRYRAVVQMTGTAYAFPPGHRVRLALSTACWPIIWPSPDAVTLTIFTGASTVDLPVRRPQPGDARVPPLPHPEAAPSSPMIVLREGRLERSVTMDQVSGEVTHRLYIDGGVFGPVGKLRLEAIGMEMGHVYDRSYRIGPEDPNSAQAIMTQSWEMGRGDWQVKIETYAQMTSTHETFELDAWLEAREGDALVCRREWKSSVPRTDV
ncbi:MAG: CocE/NonD family hydrolase [Gammaproteobacteria bacterium]|nr:CocE/NonD family hydrolase [Gammaproteobacteria bacterium]